MTSDAPVRVAVDFASPHAFLALAPTRALAAELQIEVDWLPFRVEPQQRRAAARPADERGTRHRFFRQQYAEREIARYAEAQGLVIRELYRATDTSPALVGLLFARRTGARVRDAYLDLGFERHWRCEVDLGDQKTIAGLLAASGAPPGFEAFSRTEGPTQLAALRSELVTEGVFDVPTYLVQDDLLLGRQHLPYIRHLLP